VANDATTRLSLSASGIQVTLVEFNKPADIEKLQAIRGVLKVNPLPDNTYEIESDKTDVREPVFKFAVENNLTVLSLQKSEKGLEEIFQQLTKVIRKPAQ